MAVQKILTINLVSDAGGIKLPQDPAAFADEFCCAITNALFNKGMLIANSVGKFVERSTSFQRYGRDIF